MRVAVLVLISVGYVALVIGGLEILSLLFGKSNVGGAILFALVGWMLYGVIKDLFSARDDEGPG